MNDQRIVGAWVLLTVAACVCPGWQESGPQLIRQGKLEEAFAVYRAGVEASPKSAAANNGAGVVLDLMGRYPEARQYFAQAIKASRTPLERALAQGRIRNRSSTFLIWPDTWHSMRETMRRRSRHCSALIFRTPSSNA
jgi:tetratricopeptide (TPR) repeat protein